MRKDEMSEIQLVERKEFLDMLTSAGWEVTDVGDWFEKGQWANRESNLLFSCENQELRASYSAKERSVFLTVGDHLGKSISIQLSYEEKLVSTLNALIEVQNILSTKNYQFELEGLITACPHVYSFRDEGSVWAELIAGKEDKVKEPDEKDGILEQAISLLEESGWHHTEWQFVGRTSAPLKCLSYNNGEINFRLGVFSGQNYVLLAMQQKKGADLPTTRLTISEKLIDVLAVLTKKQEKFVRSDYPDLIQDMLKHCRTVFIETDKGLIKAAL